MSDEMLTNGFRAGVLSRQERNRIGVLTRRLQHLDARIARRRDAGFPDDKINYDLSEACALRWAIEAITGEAAP